MKGARELALLSLVRCEKEGRYSNIELSNTLESSPLSDADKALYTRLTYGVIEAKITLDYLLDRWSSRPTETLDSFPRNILRLGALQILRFDRVPDHAAVDESVELAKRYCKGAAGFVNAVLRRAAREKENVSALLPRGNDAGALSVRYSFPRWLCEKFLADFGADRAETILAAFDRVPPLTLRVNTLRTTRDALLARLRGDGIEAEPTVYSPYGIRLRIGVARLSPLAEGECFVQDEASQLCVEVLGALPGEEILDTCACPGGKSFGIAMRMENRGSLLSCDLHENKLSLVRGGAERMGITILTAAAKDGGERDPALVGRFDRILCDLPCSGLGVMAKKPELRYKKEEDLSRLPAVQLRILQNTADYLKSGGRMVFSTCTLAKEENESVLRAFLAGRPDFSLVPFTVGGIPAEDGMLTLFPDLHGTDGFFISLLQKQ